MRAWLGVGPLILLGAACSQPGSRETVEANDPDNPSASVIPEPVRETSERPEGAFARAREDIDVFCGGDAACSDEQRKELGYFVNMMAAFDNPDGAVAERCLRSARAHNGVDWTIATPCMREAFKGKPLGATIK